MGLFRREQEPEIDDSGANALRAAVALHARKHHLGKLALEAGIGPLALEQWALNNTGTLTADALDKIAKFLFDHAYDASSDKIVPRTQGKEIPAACISAESAAFKPRTERQREVADFFAKQKRELDAERDAKAALGPKLTQAQEEKMRPQRRPGWAC